MSRGGEEKWLIVNISYSVIATNSTVELKSGAVNW
jgi:hypothetical protein